MMRQLFLTILLSSLFALGGCTQAVVTPDPPIQTATIPLEVELNVPIITLNLTGPNKTARNARFAFDSGGGAIIFTKKLADELGLQPTGPAIVENSVHLVPVAAPIIRIGGLTLDIRPARLYAAEGPSIFVTRDHTDGMIPSQALLRYRVIIDYPQRQFTISETDAPPAAGKSTPAPFHPEHAFPRIEATIDGQTHGFLLDTGASCTMIRRDLIDQWNSAHPGWPSTLGAVGPTNMDGSAQELIAKVVRIPRMQFAGYELQGVLAVSRANENFEWMSAPMTAPIVGSIAGNVLRHFRVEIDYPHQIARITKSPTPDAHDGDTLGLILKVNEAGALIVAGISPNAAWLTRQNIQPGDRILQIGNWEPTLGTLAGAADAMHGEPGDQKKILIERSGKQLTVLANVIRIL